MKVIFFGLGSIGQRQVKVLLDNFDFQLFAYRSKQDDKKISRVKQVHSWAEVEEIKPDIAFITNPTFMHVDTALRCAQLNMKLFVEKPIGHSLEGLDLLIREIAKRNLVSYVAYNFRFHPVIKHLKQYLNVKRLYHVSVHNSSYLPNWRANQDYRNSYTASVKQGGGVILDLSHEFDYIEYLFGGITNIRGRFGRVSSLGIDCEDFLDAAIKTERAEVNLHLDFFSVCPKRTIEIDYEGGFIFADLLASSIDRRKGKSHSSRRFRMQVDDTYREQAEYFFKNINNSKMMNNLSEASVLFKKIIEFKNNFQ